VFGRLKPDVTLAGARAELNTIWARLQPPRRNGERTVEQIRVGAYVDALTGALYGKNTIGSAVLGMLLVTLFVLFLAVRKCGHADTRPRYQTGSRICNPWSLGGYPPTFGRPVAGRKLGPFHIPSPRWRWCFEAVEGPSMFGQR
jgi:hypothetical protein